MVALDDVLRHRAAVRGVRAPAGREPLLILWDIDGTLLQRASRRARAGAAARAARRCTATTCDSSGVRVEAAGRTDGAIARDLLRAVRRRRGAHRRGVAEVARLTAEAYEELCPADLSGMVAPGIPELLASLDDALPLVAGDRELRARSRG